MARSSTFNVCVAIVATLLILAAPAIAQTRVSTISVEGNQRIPDSTVVSLSGVSPGQVLSDGEVNDVLQAVLASGFFETASIRTTNAGLVIEVVERPTINRINIEGNDRLE